MESGNPVNYNSYRTVQQYQPLYNQLVKAADCWHAIDNLDCLRQVDFDTLNNLLNTSDASSWQPIVDGDFIARWGSIQLEEGAFVHVPILDGANTDEGTSFGPQGVNSTQDFIDFASSSDSGAYLPKYFAKMLPDVYPNEPAYWIPPVETVGDIKYPEPFGKGTQFRRSAAYFGDAVMIANRRGACQTWAANGLAAYCYRFNTRPNGVPWMFGVPHFQEVAFVFDNTQGLGYNEEHGTVNPFGGEPKSYRQLAKLMSSSWASFIADLDPNSFKGRYADADQWPVYSLDNPQNIVFDANKTQLAYAEPDTWRKEGIQWILDHAKDYHR
jgi:carboxylesterase type B